MGTAVVGADGKAFGRVREFAVAPLTDATRVEALVVRLAKAARGDSPTLVAISSLKVGVAGQLRLVADAQVWEMRATDDYLLLERDLLDQQIIDVNGHKVVRVNDVDLVWEKDGDKALVLRIAEVEVGLRGAARRLLKGLPEGAVQRIACSLRPAVIPWDFVDLIDRDPARRVRLKIEQERLAKMHPSDLADILEELAPAEREALVLESGRGGSGGGAGGSRSEDAEDVDRLARLRSGWRASSRRWTRGRRRTCFPS